MSFGHNRLLRSSPGLLFAALIGLLLGCAGEHPQTTFKPVTDFGTEIDDLFWWVFWWTLPILVIVEVVLLWLILRFRRRNEDERPRAIHGNTVLEVIWTLIPAVIVIAIAVPTVRTIFRTQRSAPADGLVVEVVGRQWWWEFRYPDLGVVTANEFYVPAGRPISFRIRSADVVHSFWVPRLGGKRDANPPAATRAGEVGPRVNYINLTASEPGIYDGQCAEFCGLSHAIMMMRAVVVPPAEFDAWVASMKVAPQAAPAPGAAAEAAPASAAAMGQPIPGPGPVAPGGQPLSPPAAAPRGGGTRLTLPKGPATGAREAIDPALAARGQQVFMSRACIACHAVAGTNARGVIGPSLTRFGTRWSVGAGALENTPENVYHWIRDPQGVKSGALMPGAAKGAGGMPATGLTDEEVQAVAAYLSSLR